MVIICVLIAAAFGGWKWYEVEQSRPAGGVSSVRLPLLENFELTERSGKTFRSDDMAGKVWRDAYEPSFVERFPPRRASSYRGLRVRREGGPATGSDSPAAEKISVSR